MELSLGRLMMTPGVQSRVDAAEIMRAVVRHQVGDWGDVSQEDWDENELSVSMGFRVLSAYTTESGIRFWVITEADRSLTTVLLPEEY
jgi:hypothetical protein